METKSLSTLPRDRNIHLFVLLLSSSIVDTSAFSDLSVEICQIFRKLHLDNTKSILLSSSTSGVSSSNEMIIPIGRQPIFRPSRIFSNLPIRSSDQSSSKKRDAGINILSPSPSGTTPPSSSHSSRSNRSRNTAFSFSHTGTASPGASQPTLPTHVDLCQIGSAAENDQVLNLAHRLFLEEISKCVTEPEDIPVSLDHFPYYLKYFFSLPPFP